MTGNDFEGDRLEHVPNPRALYRVWQVLLDYGYGRGGATAGASSPSKPLWEPTMFGAKTHYTFHETAAGVELGLFRC